MKINNQIYKDLKNKIKKRGRGCGDTSKDKMKGHVLTSGDISCVVQRVWESPKH